MRQGFLRRSLLLATSMLVVPVLAMPAFAQQTDTGNASETGGIPEIIVTAQRHAENVLSVPLSLTALTNDSLTKEGIRNFTELEYATPGYYVASGAGYSNLFIRGIGNNINVGADPSVAVFVDDVPRLYGQLFNKLTDVERVEILKGAQGGLYGRNATGGVINVITRQPDTEKFSGNALLDYGEKNTFRAAGYVNVPIMDKLAASVAVERDSHDPYLRNIATNPTPYTAAMFPGNTSLGTPAQTAAALNSYVHLPSGTDNQDLWAMDTKILLKPSDNFKFTVAADYNQKFDTDGDDFFEEAPAYLLGVVQNGYLAAAGIPANLPASLAVSTQGKFTLARAIDPEQKILDYGGSGTAVLSLPGVDLTSISAYRINRGTYYEDVNGLPIPTLDPLTISDKWFFYQELRAVSTNTGRFQYLGGVTYLDSQQTNASFFTELPPVLLNAPLARSHDVVHNWSVYAQAGYDITDALNLTVSGRYIHETNNNVYIVPPGSGSFASVEKKFLPSATLSYKFDGGGNAYARWARGFKTGGVNPFNPPSFFNGNPSLGALFGGETVDTYEVGYRAPLLDYKMQLTTAIFYNDYTNLQYQAHGNAAHSFILTAIVNLNSARTWGAEEGLTWQVAEPLTLGINAGYLNAKYVNAQVTDTTVLTPVNLSGTQMLDSPKIQLSFSADFNQPINNRIKLVADATVSHLSTILFGTSAVPGVIPDAKQPPYWMTDIRVGVRTSDDRYELALVANNLFNVAYIRFGASTAGQGTLGTWGEPRIIRGEITAKF